MHLRPLLVLSAVAAMAKVPLSPLGYDPAFSTNSFLDLSKFEMKQSYSAQYTSGSMGSYSTGVYLNQLSYALSPRLSSRLDLAMRNLFYAKPSTGLTSSKLSDMQFDIPNVGLQYQGDRWNLSVQYSQWNCTNTWSCQTNPYWSHPMGGTW